jgi:hypothetical protein
MGHCRSGMRFEQRLNKTPLIAGPAWLREGAGVELA